MKKFFNLMVILVVLNTAANAVSPDTITVYSARKAHLIEPLFTQFTKDTGIKVEILTGKGSALIERLRLEGKKTRADLFMTVDAGNLWYAGTQGIFQEVKTAIIKSSIPDYLRDPDGLWSGLSVRSRTIVYNSDKVKPADLSTYADLSKPKWQGRLCLRTAKKIYTKSLVASLIFHHGKQKTREIVKGWVNNLAATPHAKDSQVMSAISSGQCDVGLVNTYYYGRLLAKSPNTKLKLFWANQATTGVHVNVSGAGVTKYAPNPKAGILLLEWLTSAKAQAIYATINKEYPANQNVFADSVVRAWGDFRQDKMNLSWAGKLQAEAVRLMQKQNYK